MCLQGACVVGHEILRTLDDPGQVAHAELVRVEEGGASVRRVGSESACALPAADSATLESRRPTRKRSAVGRSRQRRSQWSSATATF